MIPGFWQAPRGGAQEAAVRLLSPFAVTFGQVVRWRNRYFDRGHGVRRVDLPVVAVGGLTVGGGGKTPAVLTVAGMLQTAGRTVAVASRGYGTRPGPEPLRIAPGASWSVGGDEPLLIARALEGVRVYVHPDRWRAAQQARDDGADVVVLDDGFQHRRLHRDLDLVALDASEPVGNGWMMPAGPLREPPAALARAQVVWISRADQATAEQRAETRALIARRAPEAVVVEAVYRPMGVRRLDGHGEVAPPDTLAGARVQLWAGIALPERFAQTLESLGARIVGRSLFSDHHPYGPDDLARVAEDARRQGAECVVTTGKDAVRLDRAWPVPDLPAYALMIRPELTRGADLLRARLLAALER